VRKLDRVSGNLENLDQVYTGDNRFEWAEEEDGLFIRMNSCLLDGKVKKLSRVERSTCIGNKNDMY